MNIGIFVLENYFLLKIMYNTSFCYKTIELPKILQYMMSICFWVVFL